MATSNTVVSDDNFITHHYNYQKWQEQTSLSSYSSLWGTINQSANQHTPEITTSVKPLDRRLNSLRNLFWVVEVYKLWEIVIVCKNCNWLETSELNGFRDWSFSSWNNCQILCRLIILIISSNLPQFSEKNM